MPVYDQNLARIAALAAARQDEFEVLRYTLEFIEDELPDAALDALVDEVAAPIIAAIDCTACANCCATIDVYLTPADADRLAEALQLPVADVIAWYIDREAAARVEEWGRFRHSPCALLVGKLCCHYAHRPDACRAYPALTPDFRWTLADTLEGAGRCPIIYHVLDALCRQFDTAV
ncbi:MAG: YkgJ family cysteine cluster protein [Anaerolineae bacterium]|nr:YkgJ family cysteine cluster protein [Anaerolineae bacterium]